MARRIAKRSDWRRTDSGAWTCSIGERGLRVRLFQKRSGGTFHREFWTAGKANRLPLDTTDKDEALRLGRLFFAELLKGEVLASPTRPLTLQHLWRKYSTECAEHLDNKPKTRDGSKATAQLLLGYFGDDFEVDQLTRDHQRAYERARQAGGIVKMNGKPTRATRARAAEQDISLLHTMLRWVRLCERLTAHSCCHGIRCRALGRFGRRIRSNL
jgi:hypothetical protein